MVENNYQPLPRPAAFTNVARRYEATPGYPVRVEQTAEVFWVSTPLLPLTAGA